MKHETHLKREIRPLKGVLRLFNSSVKINTMWIIELSNIYRQMTQKKQKSTEMKRLFQFQGYDKDRFETILRLLSQNPRTVLNSFKERLGEVSQCYYDLERSNKLPGKFRTILKKWYA